MQKQNQSALSETLSGCVCVCECMFVCVCGETCCECWWDSRRLIETQPCSRLAHFVCVRVCVCVSDWWAVGLLLECVVMVNVIRVCVCVYVCYINVCLVIGYISLCRACKQNQIKKHLLWEVHTSIHHPSISQLLIQVRVAVATGQHSRPETAFSVKRFCCRVWDLRIFFSWERRRVSSNDCSLDRSDSSSY